MTEFVTEMGDVASATRPIQKKGRSMPKDSMEASIPAESKKPAMKKSMSSKKGMSSRKSMGGRK
jgi:hypothetical protein